MAVDSQSLTVSYPTLVNVVFSPCFVSIGYETANPPDPLPQAFEFQAIWDTGATASVITQEVVDKLGLTATGMTKVHGIGGETLAEKYVVNITLMQGVVFPGAEVTKGKLIGGPSVLIGMDIISKGDFAITNLNGQTVMTYRYPSCAKIDFVVEHAAKAKQAAFVASKMGRPQTGGWHKPNSRKKK